MRAYASSLPTCEPQKTLIRFILHRPWSMPPTAPARERLAVGGGRICGARGARSAAREAVDVRFGHRYVRPSGARRVRRDAQRRGIGFALPVSLVAVAGAA